MTVLPPSGQPEQTDLGISDGSSSPTPPRIDNAHPGRHEFGARLTEATPASTLVNPGVGKQEQGNPPQGAPRRRRRGGTRRKRRGTSAGAAPSAPAPPEAQSPEAAAPPPARRKRRSRSRRGGSKAVAAPAEADARAVPSAAEAPQGARPSGSRRRRGSRGGRRRARKSEGPVGVEYIPGEEDELSELAAEERTAAESTQAARNEKRGKSRSEKSPVTEAGEGGGRKARKKRGRSGSEETVVTEGVPNQIIVNAADREELRVAVVEDDQLVDFQMTVRSHKSLVNDIYRGRVVNLEPAIGAAFVDFGQGRNGFLHASDVLAAYGDKDWSLAKLLTFKVDPEEWDAESSQPDVAEEVSEDEEPLEKPSRSGAKKPREHVSRGRRQARPNVPIAELLQKGQSVVVQITKDAIGDKGPTLTTYISIPGRYLVLMPSMSRTGVSRKIDDEKERRRLKKILQGLENLPEGMGVIVRTAGIGCSQKDLQRDLDYLLVLWESFEKRLNLGRGPAPLYEESDIAIRTVRDLFTQNTEAVIVDDEAVYERVREFAGSLMPEAVERIRLHKGPRPLFHTHSIEQDFERIFARRIELPSGGSIVFDPTEALVAIDVNSGKTRSPGAEFEEIALKTNLEAAPEIARQIRLRDLGGIIVCDFIDMLRAGNRRAVERAFRLALAKDRARSKVGRVSQFGLLELTRQRLGPGLSRMLFVNCPHCRGSGRVRTVESRAGAILRRLGAALTLKGFTQVEIRAVPEVIECLQTHSQKELAQLEEDSQRKLVLIPVPGQVEDNVLRYLRQDGREVRPGGRRKR